MIFHWLSREFKGYIFYCPNHSTRIVKSGNVRLIENGKINGTTELRKVKIQEVKVQVPLPVTSSKIVVLVIVVHTNNFLEQQINNPVLNNEVINNESVAAELQEITLRRFQRQRKFVTSNNYVVYLQ